MTITAIINNTTWAKLSSDIQAKDSPKSNKVQLHKGNRIVDLVSFSVENDHYKLEVVPNEFVYLWIHHADILSSELLSNQQFYDIAIYAEKERLNILLPEINKTLARYEINTPLRKAHFLAQVGHESDGFNTNEEYASGVAYEWRTDLGNVFEGDGVRFKGRGLIQVTGRANYEECSQALNINLIDSPQRLADFDLACLSAGWYWDSRNLNKYADADDFERITRIINGGINGYEDRLGYLERAKSVFNIQ